MLRLCEKEECTGCFLCKYTCFQNAIDIETDSMGFSYPTINEDKCINCGKCRRVCHICNPVDLNKECKGVYRYKGIDDIRLVSSSGGFFSLVSSYLQKKDYYVAGVVFDDDFMGAHYEITKSWERIKEMRKSKYIEAKLFPIFPEAEQILKNGGKILFVGLPCQVASFMKFINGRFEEKVITVDLICFGNGSSLIYKRSLLKLLRERKCGDNVQKVDFRHKPFKKETHLIIDIKVDGKTKSFFCEEFPYYYGYANKWVCRASCYGCTYDKCERVGDITIGDVIGDHDPYGENVVMVNSLKGMEVVKKLFLVDNSGFCIADESFCKENRNRFGKISYLPERYLKIKNTSDIDYIINNYLNYRKDRLSGFFNRIKRGLVRIFNLN